MPPERSSVAWQASGGACRALDAAVERGVASRLAPGRYLSEHPAGGTLADALDALGVGADTRLLVMHDGQRVAPDGFAERVLEDGARLALLPALRAG